MTDPTDQLHRQGLCFFGSVGAGLSHEFSNVLNIVNELAGLQQDIAGAAAEAGTGGMARVVDLAARIKSQVARAEELNSSLHKLSHSVDSENVSFDLGDVLTLFQALSARAARLAEVRLQVEPPDVPLALQGGPFALLVLLHGWLQPTLRAAAEHRDVRVTAEARGRGARLIFGSVDPLPPDAEIPGAEARELRFANWCAAISIERPAGAVHRIVVDLIESRAAPAPAKTAELEG